MSSCQALSVKSENFLCANQRKKIKIRASSCDQAFCHFSTTNPETAEVRHEPLLPKMSINNLCSLFVAKNKSLPCRRCGVKNEINFLHCADTICTECDVDFWSACWFRWNLLHTFDWLTFFSSVGTFFNLFYSIAKVEFTRASTETAHTRSRWWVMNFVYWGKVSAE